VQKIHYKTLVLLSQSLNYSPQSLMKSVGFSRIRAVLNLLFEHVRLLDPWTEKFTGVTGLKKYLIAKTWSF
jgi:hypothetical protein